MESYRKSEYPQIIYMGLSKETQWHTHRPTFNFPPPRPGCMQNIKWSKASNIWNMKATSYRKQNNNKIGNMPTAIHAWS